jgi:hypothetical protein
MIPIHTLCPIYLRRILILPSHLRLHLPSGLFPSGFVTKTLYTVLISHARYMPSPRDPPWFDHPNIWRRVQIVQLLTTQFSPASCYILPLIIRPNIDIIYEANSFLWILIVVSISAVSNWLMFARNEHQHSVYGDVKQRMRVWSPDVSGLYEHNSPNNIMSACWAFHLRLMRRKVETKLQSVKRICFLINWFIIAPV